MQMERRESNHALTTRQHEQRRQHGSSSKDPRESGNFRIWNVKSPIKIQKSPKNFPATQRLLAFSCVCPANDIRYLRRQCCSPPLGRAPRRAPCARQPQPPPAAPVRACRARAAAAEARAACARRACVVRALRDASNKHVFTPGCSRGWRALLSDPALWCDVDVDELAAEQSPFRRLHDERRRTFRVFVGAARGASRRAGGADPCEQRLCAAGAGARRRCACAALRHLRLRHPQARAQRGRHARVAQRLPRRVRAACRGSPEPGATKSLRVVVIRRGRFQRLGLAGAAHQRPEVRPRGRPALFGRQRAAGVAAVLFRASGRNYYYPPLRRLGPSTLGVEEARGWRARRGAPLVPHLFRTCSACGSTPSAPDRLPWSQPQLRAAIGALTACADAPFGDDAEMEGGEGGAPRSLAIDLSTIVDGDAVTHSVVLSRDTVGSLCRLLERNATDRLRLKTGWTWKPIRCATVARFRRCSQPRGGPARA